MMGINNDDKFIKNLLILEKENNISKGLDLLFDTVDDYLISHDFDRVDKLILDFIREIKSFDFYVGFLTIINLYKGKIKNITILREKAIETGQSIMTLEETKLTLTGLI